ncbi:Site-specific recombinase, phage integrase family [Pseudomonas amygdali pv. mori]|uniref:Site-specific recombinase, phage integrase family n=2 Tax=Pseudomonas amygdali TaxID=47877 RepID=A0A3M5IMQ8_PSEA0|nr:Site-specific recombinase, phage integrase family [Pseudomonas amygdali pv. mori]
MLHKMLHCVHYNNLRKKMSTHSEKCIKDESPMSVDNLILRKGTYHVRVRVPPELQKVMGRNEFTKSLKTGSKAEANIKKLPIIAAIRQEIEKFKNVKKVEKGDYQEEAYEYAKKIDASNQKSILAVAMGSELYSHLDLNSGVQMQGHWHKRQEALLLHKKEITQNEFDKRDKAIDEWILKWTSKASGHAFTGPSNLTMADKIQANTELSALTAINDAMDRITRKHDLKPKEKEIAKEILKKPEAFSPKSDFTDERLKYFSAYQSNVRKVIQKTVDMQVSRLKTIRSFLTENKFDLNHKTIRTWLDQEQKLSAKTKKQYVLAGNTFYKWAINNVPEFEDKYQDIKPPFQGHEFPVARTGKAQKEGKRKPYTKEQAELLFTKAVAQNGKNRQPLMDAIRIGAYTGMRIEEICKIQINRDLVDDEGVYSFSLDDGKNESAIRNIPIHPELLPIIERLKKTSKDEFLMPSPAGNQYDIRSDYLSKAFGRLKTAAGFTKQHVFHSFRGTVVTQLQRKNIPPLTIVSIVGHEPGNVTFDIYSAGASAEQKDQAVKTLSYDFPE